MTCEITHLRVERYRPPFIGIGHAAPRISWSYEGDIFDWEQQSFELRLRWFDGHEELHREETSRCLFIPWPWRPLRSRQRVLLSVRAFGKDGSSTAWQDVVIEAALLEQSDWTAEVTTTNKPQPTDQPIRPFILRRTFSVSNPSESSRLYISALGLYQAFLNGQRLGDHCLAPGWQSYRHRLHYQTLDASSLLKASDNVLEVWVGEGWYAGRLGWTGGKRCIYGDEIGLMAQFEVNGQPVVWTGDDGWEWSYGELLNSELYDGETVDFGQRERFWSPTRTSARDRVPSVISPEAPPVRQQEIVSPVEILTTPSGKTILDFGQNLVGWLRIKRTPPSGTTTITLRHAEVLDKGELGVRPLRLCKATDTITLVPGLEKDVVGWEPKFTFHGFRYAQVDGWKGIGVADFEAVVVHSDMRRLGQFKCSHEWMTKFHQNTVWGLKGNFISVPTDCPQRDERLGWTGDLMVFCATANFLYDTAGLLGNWLHDLALEQLTDCANAPPLVVPNILGNNPKTFAIWADVTICTPLDLYVSTGDDRFLRDQWESMTAWMDKRLPRDPAGTGLWDPAVQQLGDWLDPTAPENRPDDSPSDTVLVANAFLVRSTQIMSRIASTLGREDDAIRYHDQMQALRKAFRDQYISPNGMIMSDTQTTLALAIEFDLVPPESMKAAGKRLDYHVRRRAFQIRTGFAGTPVILRALVKAGYTQTAYRMFQEKQCPSLLYPISMGATTIWERWNSLLPDGSINPGEMTSFNHYALGSVSRFLYETTGGISPMDAGWKRVLIKPQPGGTVRSAEVSHESPYGLVKCAWRYRSERGKLEISIQVPPNSSARIEFPNGNVEEVGSGSREWTIPYSWPAEWPVKVLQPPPMRPQLLDEVVE